jgi:hypothetical protein
VKAIDNDNCRPGFTSYLWNTGSNTNTITITTLVNTLPSPMLMVVQKTKKYTAIVSEIASITGTIVTDFFLEKNSIVITYTGIGNYIFYGYIFSRISTFSNIVAGEYTTYARDKMDVVCQYHIQRMFLIIQVFTPNDGYNDL